VTLAFLQPSAGADNPLAPITPMRLAFFVRNALADISPAAVPETGVYDEVWARRHELAERAGETLEAYRNETTQIGDDRRVLGLIYELCAFLMAAAALTLFVVAGTIASRNFGRDPISGWLWAAAGVAGLVAVVAAAARGVARARWWDVDERVGEMYSRLIAGELTEEITMMVDEIVHREDERTRGALVHHMRAPNLVELESSAVVHSESFEDVLTLVRGHVTSAVGVAGTRGAGKTTLLRRLCDSGPEHPSPERIGVYLPAPTGPSQGRFVKVIYGATVREVIASRGVDVTERGLRRRGDDVISWALDALDRIDGISSRQRAGKAGLSRWGVSAERSAQTTWTERELTRDDWAADFRRYVKGHRLRHGAPILIAIDELDKITDADQAIEIINDIKDLFHIEGVHFVVSISDDALHRFATRGVPVRDAFDTAFDAVIEVRRLTAAESCELLRQRVRHFPSSAALFCHAWSGGLPRDLVRTARACVTLQRGKDPVALADVVHTIVRRDVAEVVDAAIRRERHRPEGPIEALITLRRLIDDDREPPHRQLAARDLPAMPGADPLLPSLSAYLDVAVAISEYYSIPRDSEQWTTGIGSGAYMRHADLFAAAKAALAVHPSEAAWRLEDARRHAR
jgi:hypothetical protein